MAIPGNMNKDKFEKILNNNIPYSADNPDFIIGGKPRVGRYGTMMRRHDPNRFYEMYTKWLRENGVHP